MKRKVPSVLFGVICVILFHVNSFNAKSTNDLFIENVDKIESNTTISSRNPKFLSYIKNLIIRKPVPFQSNQQKYGEVITNYNQVQRPQPQQTPQDPYNQNALLNALEVGGAGSASETFPFPSTALNVNTNSAQTGLETITNIFNLIGANEDISPSSIISNIINLGTGSMEKMLKRINKFDSLKCIPRLLCQTIARRQEDAAEALKTTTTSTTVKPKQLFRRGRLIKFQGVDTALEQFLGFLELMQMKEWTLYPYIKGAYEGSQVKRWDECAEKFKSCPFSDQQLVYYFNNYNGGFFQAFRSD